ncbi:hypothetical protein FIV42_15730 [Persicimonas caeni]|uniref:non-specific serine/threonine protein kinase n=1 Tax=Persicimonas caeni TaxID=2292766 RepID=A0A4Y6PV68_PERCE|nr:hypothetical protein [Persicimonas caeni]QDG52140.1 hypothetical protein FIV42_15730 [Persicimonas caeni]QED33362.1 hypothetical protein FRD00_15725 [Persicimonas caeni]
MRPANAFSLAAFALLTLSLLACGSETAREDGDAVTFSDAGDAFEDGTSGDAGSTEAMAPSRLAAGYMHTCWLNEQQEIDCWGLGIDSGVTEDEYGFDFDQAIPPEGIFEQVVSGAHYSCALSAEGQTTCWGIGSDPDAVEENTYGFDQDQAIPPDTPFTQLTAGALFACGLAADGIECWGEPELSSAVEEALTGDLVQLTAGWSHACGLTEAGRILCGGLGSNASSNEGEEDFDQGIAPAGTDFIHVSAGANHTCGLHQDGSIECWGLGSDASADEGAEDFDQAVPPATGSFTRLAAGLGHTCAIRDDATVTCWGMGSDLETLENQQADANQAVPLDGTFKDLESGALHTCGVRTDGTVVCWGWNGYAQSDPAQVNPGDECARLPASDFDRYQCSFLCQTGCRSGEACFVGQNPQVGLVTTCSAEGSGMQGEPCSSEGTCAAGFGCSSSPRGTACAKYCRPSSEDFPGCDAEAECVQQGDGFGICE